MNLENGRVVVITGASSGIGRATALKFADEGWNVVLGARRKKLLDEVAEECRERGARALAVETDVTDEEQVDDLAEQATDQFGGFDVWINDAGVGVFGRFDEVPWEDHRRVIETNVLGTMYGSREALKHFRARGRGVLINISSVSGKTSHPYLGSYVASKHAITALGMALRQELWMSDETDIHVCTVHPESVDTPFFQHAGNHTGYKIKPLPPIEIPEHTADVIFEMAVEPKDEVIVGTGGKIIAGQSKVARALSEKQMAWMTDKRMLRKGERERPHSGSLFKPMKEGAGIHGGWKASPSGKKIAAIVGAVAPLGAAAILLARRRSESAPRAA